MFKIAFYWFWLFKVLSHFVWTNFASHCIWRSIKSLKYVLYAQRCCHCILGADLLSAAGSCRAACVFISTHSPPPLNRVWALHSFLLLLNAAHTVRPLPPRSLFFFHPSSHLSLYFIHPGWRQTLSPRPVQLSPLRSFHSCSHSAHISHPWRDAAHFTHSARPILH